MNRIKPLGLLVLMLIPSAIYCQSTGSENSIKISYCKILSTTELLLECDISIIKDERYLANDYYRFILVTFAQIQKDQPIYILKQYYTDQRPFSQEQIEFVKTPRLKKSEYYLKKKQVEKEVIEHDTLPLVFSYLDYGNNFLPLKLTAEKIPFYQDVNIIPVVMFGNPNSLQKALYVMEEDPSFELFQLFQKLRLVEIEVVKYTYLNYLDCD